MYFIDFVFASSVKTSVFFFVESRHSHFRLDFNLFLYRGLFQLKLKHKNKLSTCRKKGGWGGGYAKVEQGSEDQTSLMYFPNKLQCQKYQSSKHQSLYVFIFYLLFPLLFSLGLIIAMLSLLALLRFSLIKSREW